MEIEVQQSVKDNIEEKRSLTQKLAIISGSGLLVLSASGCRLPRFPAYFPATSEPAPETPVRAAAIGDSNTQIADTNNFQGETRLRDAIAAAGFDATISAMSDMTTNSLRDDHMQYELEEGRVPGGMLGYDADHINMVLGTNDPFKAMPLSLTRDNLRDYLGLADEQNEIVRQLNARCVALFGVVTDGTALETNGGVEINQMYQETANILYAETGIYGIYIDMNSVVANNPGMLPPPDPQTGLRDVHYTDAANGNGQQVFIDTQVAAIEQCDELVNAA